MVGDRFREFDYAHKLRHDKLFGESPFSRSDDTRRSPRIDPLGIRFLDGGAFVYRVAAGIGFL